MIRTILLAGGLGLLAIPSLYFAVGSQEKQEPKPAEKKEVVFASAETAKFKELAPGASMSTVWGDADKGAHRSFVKFAPGATFALHSHTNAMRIVVIKGAYVYKPDKGEEKRVTAGCYLDLPGGDRHTSSGDAKEGALFYQESAGKFDLVPVVEKQ